MNTAKKVKVFSIQMWIGAIILALVAVIVHYSR